MFTGESKGGPARRGRGQRGAPTLAVGLQRSTACWLGLAGLGWASRGLGLGFLGLGSASLASLASLAYGAWYADCLAHCDNFTNSANLV